MTTKPPVLPDQTDGGRMDTRGHWIVQELGGISPRRVVGSERMADECRERGWIVEGPFVLAVDPEVDRLRDLLRRAYPALGPSPHHDELAREIKAAVFSGASDEEEA